MQIEQNFGTGYALLTLSGDFETYACGDFQEALDRAHEAGYSHIVLNMRGVKFMNSTGLGAILKARREVVGRGGTIAIARASAFCRDLFDTLKLSSILDLFDDTDAAIAWTLQASGSDDEIRASSDAPLFFRFHDQASQAKLPGRVASAEILSIDESSLTFGWSSKRVDLSPEDLDDMFARGAQLDIKFRLPLYKKKGHFESVTSVESYRLEDGVAKVGVTLDDLETEAAHAVRAYVEDMRFLKQELSTTRDET